MRIGAGSLGTAVGAGGAGKIFEGEKKREKDIEIL